MGDVKRNCLTCVNRVRDHDAYACLVLNTDPGGIEEYEALVDSVSDWLNLCDDHRVPESRRNLCPGWQPKTTPTAPTTGRE